jgi:hypothetical protein
MAKKMKIGWLAQPEPDDYEGALSYLTLLFDAGVAREHLARLKAARTSTFWAQDILRAAQLEPLQPTDGQVERNLTKIRDGQKLAPLLLLRQPARLIIVDGFHRLCAAHAVNAEAPVAVRIA